MSKEYELGKKMGVIESDVTIRRVVKFFVDNENKPSYHSRLHKDVGGSKTGISRALHILDGELEVMNKFYVQVPQEQPTMRMVTVLMFQLKPEFYIFVSKDQNER